MIERVVKAAKKSGLITSIRTKFPRLFLYTVVKPLSWVRYKDAKDALKGKHSNLPDKQSILLFTTQKCASTYTKTIFAKLASDVGMFTADIEAYFSVKDIDPRVYFDKPHNRKTVFQPKGKYLGPLRNFYPIENLDQYKKVLVLRDPRDVLTSFYYSILHSHIVINDTFYKKRQQYADYDIDTFVIDYLPNVKAIYQEYIDNLLDLDNLLVLPYELLVTDFQSWLDQLIRFTGLEDANPEVINEIIATEKAVRPDGKKTSHIRSKQPGDYKINLKLETQQHLTKEFSDILQKLKYPI